jgi:hypothetical protein
MYVAILVMVLLFLKYKFQPQNQPKNQEGIEVFVEE